MPFLNMKLNRTPKTLTNYQSFPLYYLLHRSKLTQYIYIIMIIRNFGGLGVLLGLSGVQNSDNFD